jgi:hypothetical protein
MEGHMANEQSQQLLAEPEKNDVFLLPTDDLGVTFVVPAEDAPPRFKARPDQAGITRDGTQLGNPGQVVGEYVNARFEGESPFTVNGLKLQSVFVDQFTNEKGKRRARVSFWFGSFGFRDKEFEVYAMDEYRRLTANTYVEARVFENPGAGKAGNGNVSVVLKGYARRKNGESIQPRTILVVTEGEEVAHSE